MKLEVENYQWIYVISFESKNSSTFKGEQSLHWTTNTEYTILSNSFTTPTLYSWPRELPVYDTICHKTNKN